MSTFQHTQHEAPACPRTLRSGDDPGVCEQEMVRAYLQGVRLYNRHTTILGVVTGIVLLALGIAIGLAAPVVYTLIATPPIHGVMDAAP